MMQSGALPITKCCKLLQFSVLFVTHLFLQSFGLVSIGTEKIILCRVITVLMIVCYSW